MSTQGNTEASKPTSSVLHRLSMINTIVIAIVLLLICGFIYVKEYYSIINRQINSLSSLGEIISDRLTGVLAFDDFDLAQKNIFTLKKNQNILAACLYDKNQKLLTSFENHDKVNVMCGESEHLITDLMVNQNILLDNESLGQLILYSNPQLVRSQMLTTLGYLILIAIFCYVLSWALARRFLRKETKPIVDLANMARTISNTGDYDLRVSKGYTPAKEIFNLVDAFNNLLDIVTRHNTELEKLVSERTLELEGEKQKVEHISQAKSEFLAKLSHDLRTPLTSILGYAEILSDRKNLQPKQTKHLDAIIRNAEFITKLVNGLLELSKLESVDLEFASKPFDLEKLLLDLEKTFIPTALHQNLELNFDIAQLQSRWLEGDAIKLQQVLNNILENALKFTHKGYVSLHVSQTAVDPQKVLNKFVITDSGMGISEDKLESIFVDYVQLEPSAYPAKGAGLGLAITKKLVELMGGTLHVESRLNVGSVFTIELPLARSLESESKKSPLPDSSQLNTQALNKMSPILIVDDDEGCRDILFNIVSSLSSDVIIYQAKTIGEARQLLEQHKPGLLFLDIELPDGNGLDFTKEIRVTDKNIIIITVSAFNDEIQKLPHELINAFIPKPFSKQDIIDVIREIVTSTKSYE